MIPRSWSRFVQRRWYGRYPIWPLIPFSILFGAVVALRRRAYARGWLAAQRSGCPVLIIGNVTVGGSGKTPFVLAVVERARRLGLRPGVVARGYGGRAAHYPIHVDANTPAEIAGDEPALIARRARVPVAVDPNRARAARALIAHARVDLVVADDGLQHYRLARDAEIAVIDARRGTGNGWLLPAGPLREPGYRANRADMVCVHGENADFWLVPGRARNLSDGRCCDLAAFNKLPVHALAGIGEPARFFDMLRAAGLTVIEHPMDDHHRYRDRELIFDNRYPVLMTEKDAVKCAGFERDDLWMVPVETVLSAQCGDKVDALLSRLASPAHRDPEQRSA